jgi:mycofactocin precursor
MPEMTSPSARASANPDGGPPVEVTATIEATNPPAPELVEEDLLVEDVSIDGMCGVY